MRSRCDNRFTPLFRQHLHALLAIAAVLLLGTPTMAAQVQEWPLLDTRLHERTTHALQRYFTVVRPDSVRLRYLERNVAILPYRIRGNHTGGDTLMQLLSLGLGQLTLYSPTTLRIALGDDLYEELAQTRNDPAVAKELREVSGMIGLDRWGERYPLMIAFDRIDYRINHTLGIFAAIGSPASNLFWWSDGTARIGLEGIDWEIALLLPYGAGSTPFGFLNERLLAPAFGATAAATLGGLSGRIRFAVPDEPSFVSPLAAMRRYVHTAGGAISWYGTLDTRYGLFLYSIGIGYEEFAAIMRDTSGGVVEAGSVRRLSPVAGLQWREPGENLRLSLDVIDIAPRFGLSAWLTERLAIELYYVANDLLREVKPFEHPSAFFLTPKLLF